MKDNNFAAMNKTLTNEQLIEAATTYGTPLYVYHAEKIKEQLSSFKSHDQYVIDPSEKKANLKLFVNCIGSKENF